MLSKNALTQDLFDAMTAIGRETDPNRRETATRELAGKMADAIDKFVKSGTVAFDTGKVTGVCASPGSPLTAGQASGGTIS